jgi:hypothetical protein
MFSLDRFEVKRKLLYVCNLNVVFTTHVLKMAPIRVCFSPGFPPGAGFHGEEFALACFERHAGAVKNDTFPLRLL